MSSKKGTRHVRLHNWLMNTKAWRSLKPGPRAMLVELYSLYNGENNGALFLSERDAGTRLNISKLTARKYFIELEDKGFIKAKEKGSFNVKIKLATKWILTEHGFANQVPTKEFTRWSEKEIPDIKIVLVGKCNHTQGKNNSANIVAINGVI